MANLTDIIQRIETLVTASGTINSFMFDDITAINTDREKPYPAVLIKPPTSEITNITHSTGSNENYNFTNSCYLAALRQQLSHHKLQNQRLIDRRMSVFNSLVELHECYETGLDGIARLNDLRNVPDNVMMDRPSNKS